MSIQEIAEYGSSVVLEDLNKLYHEEIDNFNQNLNANMDEIIQLINNLIVNMEQYQIMTKMMSNLSSSESQIMKLEMKKDLIYNDFFKLQNLINAFAYQKVIMTYVQVDPVTGQRELRIFDNDIDHLVTETVQNYGKSYSKLSYDIGDHYLKLKNSLPDGLNAGLQETAKQVTLRYEKYRKRILWKVNNEWYGYKLSNRGPINEAFTDFYLKEVQLQNSLNHNIDIFMRSVDPQGVIYADNANGFLIGDISIGGLQFAVKGAYGSPQNFTTIINWLKEIKANNFSQDAFIRFIQRFKEEERERATRLVKPMLNKSIDAMVRYHGEEKLLAALTAEK